MKNNFSSEIPYAFILSLLELLPLLNDLVEKKKMILDCKIHRGDGLIRTLELQGTWEEEQYSKLSKRYHELIEAGYFYYDTESNPTFSQFFRDLNIARELNASENYEKLVVFDNGYLVLIGKPTNSYMPTIGFQTEEDAQFFFDILVEGSAIRQVLNERTKKLRTEPEAILGQMLPNIETYSDGSSNDKVDPIVISPIELYPFPSSWDEIMDKLKQEVNDYNLLAEEEDIRKLLFHSFKFASPPLDPPLDRLVNKLKWTSSRVKLVKLFADCYPSIESRDVRVCLTNFICNNFQLYHNQVTKNLLDKSIRREVDNYNNPSEKKGKKRSS